MNVTSVQESFPAIEPQFDNIYQQNDAGFANNDGIVFSSLSGPNPVSHTNVRPPSPISSHVPTQKPATSNINNVIDNINNYYSPFNSIVKPDKPQSSYPSDGLTFAPLLIISPMPSQHPQPISNISSNPGFSNPSHETQPLNPVYQKPSSSTFSTDPVQSEQSSNSVVITQPPDQCGITNYTHSRVVGGAITQLGELTATICFDRNIVSMLTLILGQYPWIAALGYRFPNASQYGGLQFYCGGSLVSFFHASHSSIATANLIIFFFCCA